MPKLSTLLNILINFINYKFVINYSGGSDLGCGQAVDACHDVADLNRWSRGASGFSASGLGSGFRV